MFHFTKKRAIVMAVVASLAMSVGAYAYFTSTGTGTGTASVGTSAAFDVAVEAPQGGPLYPGLGTQTLSYEITNSGDGNQRLISVEALVDRSADGYIMSGTPVAAVQGCYASWFTAAAIPNAGDLPKDLNGAATSSGTVKVEIPNDHTVSQNACKGASPKITVNAG